mmetsp:Transcript_84203/g.149186  ORF Transcript_84203/g.149186 Transcript_84203/m.149186 type:complete len:156 (-) Transcript_84203:135-602(-)
MWMVFMFLSSLSCVGRGWQVPSAVTPLQNQRCAEASLGSGSWPPGCASPSAALVKLLTQAARPRLPAVVALEDGSAEAADEKEGSTAEEEQPGFLQQINNFLDKPLLDTNERGGPLEPLKDFIRDDPQMGSVVMSGIAVAFFAVVIRVALLLVQR